MTTATKRDPQRIDQPDRRTMQTFVPGTEPVTIPAIDKAAEDYRTVRDRWQEMQVEMGERAEKLLALMKEHGLHEYRYDGQLVKVVESEAKVKVNTIKDKPAKGE